MRHIVGVAVGTLAVGSVGRMRTLSLDLVSHETSICWSRMEIVPEMQSMHGTFVLHPGRAMFLKAPNLSTIFTVPEDTEKQHRGSPMAAKSGGDGAE